MAYVDHIIHGGTNWDLVSKPGADSIAVEYSTSNKYAVGDCVTYEGRLYRCKKAITTTQNWTASNWEAIRVMDTIADIQTRVEEIEKGIEWADIAATVATGAKPYAIGDTFEETWTDVAANKTYTIPWRVNHYEILELENGNTAVGMWLQMTKALPFGVAFSHNRAFLACPDGLDAGTYYVTFGGTWGSKAAVKDSEWYFTLTKPVEEGGRLAGFYSMPDVEASTYQVYSYKADGKTVVETVAVSSGKRGTDLGTLNLSSRNGNLNSMQEAGYGWNAYESSAMRQFLNGAGGVGTWWTPQDAWDIAPNELATKAGFLSGLPSGFVSAMVPVKTTTYKNTVQDGGAASLLYDKVTIPSLSQMYCENGTIDEGAAHDYYKQLNGTTTKYKIGSSNIYPELIQHDASTGSAVTVRLRSASRGGASNAFSLNSTGYFYNANATYSYRPVPFVFIGGLII